jgi:hypothetical protein
VRDRVVFLYPGSSVAPSDALQTDVGRADKLDDLGLSEHGDVCSALDPFDEIGRHRARQAEPAHHHAHVTRVAGKKYCCLPGRVSSTQPRACPTTGIG